MFGGMYRSGNNSMAMASATNGQTINMDAPLPLQNVAFSGNSTLGIQCSGTYELTFFGNFSFSSDTVLMFYVTANGTRLDETIVLKSAIANDDTTFERSVIVRLCANTSLSARVDNAPTSEGGADGTLEIPPHGFHLSAVRIGA
ncbi:MAG: hypothetical protein FWB76_05615 [Oscillospiraceae bacterium]|nr:hypothetical protein [Oscillospiraceae bacterium]